MITNIYGRKEDAEMLNVRLAKWSIAVAVVLCARLSFAQTVAPCPQANNCAALTIGSSAPCTASVTFKQGPANAAAGGIDEIAAIAFTLNTDGLKLKDCSLNADGLPNSVHVDPSISNFRVVVENASCTGGRTHCLCPGAGGPTPDPFINIVVY